MDSPVTCRLQGLIVHIRTPIHSRLLLCIISQYSARQGLSHAEYRAIRAFDVVKSDVSSFNYIQAAFIDDAFPWGDVGPHTEDPIEDVFKVNPQRLGRRWWLSDMQLPLLSSIYTVVDDADGGSGQNVRTIGSGEGWRPETFISWYN